MRKDFLGHTNIEMSRLCLGTMTFGNQTPENEAHSQLDCAFGNGINFIDTAEMYPVNPVSEETIGLTERIIGAYNRQNKSRRKEYILATKHSGEGLKHVRSGESISAKTIPSAIEGSLRRLQTDYIDLYQFHWPNRGSYMFRKNWDYKPSNHNKLDIIDNMNECLECLKRQVDKGNILEFGLSNETAWGAAQWLQIAETQDLPRVATIQNEYSLLCRLYDTDLAELSAYENIGLMAYSPLGAGLLTGKYQNGQVPAGSRMVLSPDLGGRSTRKTFSAVEAYKEVADKHGLDLAQMSVAWCLTRSFVCSAIIGATRLWQLEHIIRSADVRLTTECLDDIANVYKQYPMPY